jgi:6-phosphofructokinase 1
MAGLSIGAYAVYTPEEGISMKMLARDIEWIKQSFAKDKGQNRAGKIILRNEKASATYTTETISNMIKDEAKGRFESRYAVPGHVQQGGTPSPMDRCRAVRFGIRSIQQLESYYVDPENQFTKADGSGKPDRDKIAADPLSASVIGIRGAKVQFSSMQKIEDEETDWKDRRPKDEFWLDYRDIIDILSGRPREGAERPVR